MYFRLDKMGNIIDCSEEKYSDDCLFKNNKIKRAFDGSLMFESDMQTEEYLKRKQENDENLEVEKLRFDREKECFSVINRGILWYDNLSTEQVEKLDQWYRDWLDVTLTKTKPKKPDFV